MKRRTLLGLAGCALSGVVIVGSGAFNVSRVDRDIDVTFVGDWDGYLALDELGAGGRSTIDGGKLVLSIPGIFKGGTADPREEDELPEGLNQDAVFEFTGDIDGSEGLVEVTNQGTNEVELTGELVESDGPDIGIFDIEADPGADGLRPTVDEEPVHLGIGESINVGVRIDTTDVEPGGGDGPNGVYQATVRFVAEATDTQNG